MRNGSFYKDFGYANYTQRRKARRAKIRADSGYMGERFEGATGEGVAFLVLVVVCVACYYGVGELLLRLP